MVKEYNPFDLEKPVLNLGEHGSYKLGDITDSRQKRANAALEKLEQAEDDDFESIVDAVCELAESVCEDADGVAVKLRAEYDAERIGIKALIGMMEFITGWLNEEQSVGEG